MNFNSKYKDRAPESTIKIIKDYFNKLDYQVTEDKIIKTDSNLWWCDISLYKNNIKLLCTHGKGINKEFALASGYGELYERFANGINIYHKPVFYNYIMHKNKQLHNYYLEPGEKVLSYEELIAEPIHKSCLADWVDINKVKTLDDNVIKYICGDPCIGVPFKGITTDDTKYLSIPLIWRRMGSNGMAAGNTLDEALLQAICEILERDTLINLDNNQDQIFYKIDFSLLNKEMRDKIAEIEALGNHVILLDLSHNFGTPVIISIIQNLKSKHIVSFWRCHPVFNIAVEGAITECYQGRNTIDSESPFGRKHLLAAFAQNHKQFNLTNCSGANHHVNILPEDIYLNAQTINTINTNCYVLENDSITTKDLVKHIKEKILKPKNLKLYYHDASVCKDLKAVQIYSEDCKYFEDFNKIVMNSANFYSTVRQLIEITKNAELPLDNFTTNDLETWHIPYCFVDPFITDMEDINFYNNMLIANGEKTNDEDPLMELYSLTYKFSDNLYKHCILYDYRLNGYTKFKVKQIFDYLGDTFTDKEWFSCNDLDYIKKTYLTEYFKNIISDSNLEIMLAGYINKEFN